jgi:cyclopropane-fatty-acyl-phospholipid synthase
MVTHALRTEDARTKPGWFRRAIHRRLEALVGGELRIVERDGVTKFGTRGDLDVTVQVENEEFYRRLALGGSAGAGEAYRDGLWRTDDLVGLVRLFARNRAQLGALDGGAARLVQAVDRWRHKLRANTLRGSRRNIEAHYDLSNALFETFLDSRMMYSAAVYEADEDALDTASANKLDRIVAKLGLDRHDHLLEVGTGWGGLAVHAAARAGCRVTTITISEEQRRCAEERVRAAGLSGLVDVRNCDYRAIEGTYSKIVSVEMVEAVGNEYLDGFFRCLNRLLEPGGLLFMQAITIEDHRFASALREVDFIKKHIFPGSFIPSVSRLAEASARDTQLTLVNLEDIGLDYARTLHDWRTRFLANAARVAALGFDDRFQRLWEFYLAYCEGGFMERAISDVQLLFAKSPYRGRPWRGTVR